MSSLERLRLIFHKNFEMFAKHCLRIRRKDGQIVPLELNYAQRAVVNEILKQLQGNGKARIIVLKARQLGISTVVEAFFYWRTINNIGVKSLVVTHLDSSTRELFEMTKRYHEYCPDDMKPIAERNSVTELSFRGIDSSFKTATAGSKNIGHGSTIQQLHWSEVSRSRNQQDIVSGAMQTVPSDSGIVVLESTGDGVDDYFYSCWQAAVAGENDFAPIFFPWYRDEGYTLEPEEDFELTESEKELKSLYHLTDGNIAWRRRKISEFMTVGDGELRFKQQYPSCPDEAFMSNTKSFIPYETVQSAINNEAEAIGPVIMGVDPARNGRDHSGIAIRQGRKLIEFRRVKKNSTMELADLVSDLIMAYNVNMAYIDVIGIGAGVYDRLIQMRMGQKVREAVVSNKADDSDTYYNKRAEIWARLREWLEDGGDIPDDKALSSDLTLLGFDYDGRNRLKMQSKRDLSRSPDLGDALAMTFYNKAPIMARDTAQNRSIISARF